MIPSEKCGLDLKTQEKLNIVFNKYPEIQKVILYGSRAKGNFKNGSDIDLTIYSTQMQNFDLLKIMNDIDDLNLPYMVDISLFHHLDNKKLVEHIERVGIVFYLKN